MCAHMTAFGGILLLRFYIIFLFFFFIIHLFLENLLTLWGWLVCARSGNEVSHVHISRSHQCVSNASRVSNELPRQATVESGVCLLFFFLTYIRLLLFFFSSYSSFIPLYIHPIHKPRDSSVAI